MLKNKKLVIFDMDGTLIDSAPSLAYAINHMLKELNREPITLDRVRDFIGKGSEILVKRALLNRVDIDDIKISEQEFKNAHKILLDFYGKNLNAKTSLFPNTKETLEELQKNYKIALVTNKPHQFVSEILKHFKIDNYFDYILGATDKIAKKPAPDMLLESCKHFNIEPKYAVMVGDSSNDILAAKSANIDIIAVTYGYSNEDISTLNPTLIVDNLLEIPKVLNG